jgi:hypothetical protein
LSELRMKDAGNRLFGPNPGGKPMVKPQYPTLSPSNVWPFESKSPGKSPTTRASFESGKKVGRLFDESA